MKRALFITPANTDFNDLPESIQQHLQQVGFQLQAPMPGTQIVDGMMVADGVAHSDDLNPEDFNELGWQLLYYSQYPDIVHVPVDWASYMPFVSDVPVCNEEGELVGTEPAPQRLTHSWSGWEV